MTTFAYIAVIVGAAACTSSVMRLVSLFERPEQFQRRHHRAAV